MWILLIYLIVSILLLFLYHFTKYAKRIPDYWKGKSTLGLTLFYFLRSIVFLIVWPGLIAQFLNDEIKNRYRMWKYSKHLYFTTCAGGGNIVCKGCGHEEKIVSAVHHLVDCDYRLGFQCQNCGKHVAVTDPFKYKALPRCECGGKLSREKPIFCSQCGSKKVTYRFQYIT